MSEDVEADSRAVLVCATGANAWGKGFCANSDRVVSDHRSLVSGAKVILKDAISGRTPDDDQQRRYFTFASVPVGSYELSVEAQGFQTYRRPTFASVVPSGAITTSR